MSTGTADASIAIKVSRLSKSIGSRAILRDVSFNVGRAQIHALLGANGSGKTSLLRIFAGIWQPDSGSVEIRLDPPLRIGYAAQRFCLYEDLTVCENLQFQARMRACSASVIAASAQQFDLQALRDRLAGTLSGGQRQRLVIAAALMHRPTLLLLDEPTTALDAESRKALWTLLRREVERGTTVVVTTHEVADALHCDAATHLQEGKCLIADLQS